MKGKKALHALVAAGLIAAGTSSVEAKEPVKTDIKGKIEKVLITEKLVETEIEYLGIKLKVKVKWKDFQKSRDGSTLMDIEFVKVEPSNEETYNKLVEYYEGEKKLNTVLQIIEDNIRKKLNDTYLLDKNLEEVVTNIGFDEMHEVCGGYFYESSMKEIDKKVMAETEIQTLKAMIIVLGIILFGLISYTTYDIIEGKNKLRKQREELRDKYLKYFKEKHSIDLNNPSVLKSVETLLPNIEVLINKIQDIRKTLEEQGIFVKTGGNNTEILGLLIEGNEFIEAELKNSNTDKDTLDKLSKMHNLINEATFLYGKIGIDLTKRGIDFETAKEIFSSIMKDTQSTCIKN